MSNPITSVPDPSATAASSSSNDPLANIITQVSPSAAGAPTRGGPARPTRVAKTGEQKKKKKEKKDGGGGAALVPSTATGEASGSTAAVVTPGTTEPSTKPEDEDQQASHSQKPSSTLVGTTTTKGSNILPASESELLAADKPSDAAATPTEPNPVSTQPLSHATRQDMTLAAEKLQGESETTGDERHSASSTTKLAGTAAVTSGTTGGRATDEKGRTTAARSKKTAAGTAKPSGSSAKSNKPSLMKKLIAVLTCSSVSGAAVAAEESEMSEKSKSSGGKSTAQTDNKSARKTASNARLAPRSTTQRGSRVPSRRSSLDKTVGGGTRLPRDETGDVMSGAVVPPGSSFVVHEVDAKKASGGTASSSSVQKDGDDEDGDEDDDEGDEDDEWMGEDQMDIDEDQTEEQRLILQGGAGIPRDEHGELRPLLGPIGDRDSGRKCLVLDLDETLVHSSFKMISNADFTVPVEIEGTVHNVYVIKRPGVDEFMRRMGEIYEVVVFTASLSKYADPVLDILDIHQVVRHRLFRESCYNHRGNYVKDLSQLGRQIETSIIIDNSPASYIFHPNNAVPISSWFNDPHDTELTDLCPFLAELAEVQDVRAVLDGGL